MSPRNGWRFYRLHQIDVDGKHATIIILIQNNPFKTAIFLLKVLQLFI